MGGGPQYHSLVYGVDLVNVTIRGGGTLDGNGPVWWQWYNFPPGYNNRNATNPASAALDQGGRGHTLQLVGIRGLVIQDITLRRSPSWTFRLTFSSDVLLERLHVRTRDPMYCPKGAAHCFQPCNEDGVDIEGCSDVIVRDSDVYSHDDAIVLKSGRTPHGALATGRRGACSSRIARSRPCRRRSLLAPRRRAASTMWS